MGCQQELCWPASQQPLAEYKFWTKFNAGDIAEEHLVLVDMTEDQFVDAVVWCRRRFGAEGTNWLCAYGKTTVWHFPDPLDLAEFLLIWPSQTV